MLRSTKTQVRRIALVLPLLLAAACGGSSSSGGSTGPSDIRIGVVLSTSGKGAVFGVDQRNGVTLAAQMINDGGGIGGHHLLIDFQDSAYTKTQAQSIISKMAADQSIIGLIGPTSSAEAFAADPMANSAKLPVLAISNGSKGIPQIGKFVHRVGVPEPLLLPSVVNSVVKANNLKTAAIVYASNDPFALTGYEAFSAALKAQGVAVTDVVPYDSDKTVNFTPQLRTIAGHQPQALFLAVKSDEGAVILRQIQQLHFTVPMVGNLAFTSTPLLQAAGNAADGLIVGATWSAAEPSELNKQFVAGYQQKFHKPATPLAATAFNAVYLIKQALLSAKTINRASLQQGIDALPGYAFVGSPIDFVDVGDGLRDASTPTPVLLQAKNGQLVVMPS